MLPPRCKGVAGLNGSLRYPEGSPMTDVVIRSLAPGEKELFESLPDPGLVGFAAFGDTYIAMAAAGEYRPEWTWTGSTSPTPTPRCDCFARRRCAPGTP
ncbi:hypothetical protein GCM10009557_51880 [Virgisporangium ochraceum]|uniref:Uncharacterized protein n=1 Tax=Virgisporangium ochraceum TaxID=65505 RepID=A0A8J4A8F5_9ACTN|nr:hypothetical protein Voc01_097730 [Virgisporangium ochraceum]